MSILTSDGKELVYAVFDDDGYECSSLVAVFSSEASANLTAQILNEKEAKEWAWLHSDHPDEAREDQRRFTVMCITLDKEPDVCFSHEYDPTTRQGG